MLMTSKFTLTVNGQPYSVEVAPNTPLLYVLRNDLGLNGPQFGCGSESCGACTVFLGAKAIKSCKVPVSGATLGAITTLEGLGTAEELHPVQRAFIAEQAAQCGYCTSGLIMTTAAFLWKTPIRRINRSARLSTATCAAAARSCASCAPSSARRNGSPQKELELDGS
jgi:nicotinate dehydrogenase subunit A